MKGGAAWRVHAAAAVGLALLAAFVMRGWFLGDVLPGEDFPGYVAAVAQAQAWLEAGEGIPDWCAACFGGASVMDSHLKEILAFPLAVATGPVLATKLAFALFKWLGALGIYALFSRWLGAPGVGFVAGAVYGFGAWANHEASHLDAALSAALWPWVLFAAAALLRGGGRVAALALGVLAACLFANSWVQALLGPILFGLLWWLRPWCDDGDEWPGLRARLAPVALALAVFVVFAASSATWLLADAGHHRLIPASALEEQREAWSEGSPLGLLDRDAGGHYLGWVVAAVVILGSVALRRRRPLLRWAQLGGLLFLIWYALALGPASALDRASLSAGPWPLAFAVAALGLALAAGVGWHRGAPRGRAELLAGSALVLALACIPLWSVAAALLPPLSLQRSPGHFADCAHLGWTLLFGVALLALARRLPSPTGARAFLVATSLLVAWDFAPSARRFELGIPLAAVERARGLAADLPREGRVALAPLYSPFQSFLVDGAGQGHAWGWLPWQANPYWQRYLASAAWRFGGAAHEDRQALLALGRIRTFFLDERHAQGPRRLPPPWRRVAAAGQFSVWEQPSLLPFATGRRGHSVWRDAADDRAAARVAEAERRGEVVIFAGAAAGPSLPEGAAGESFAVETRRPGSGHISLSADAGAAPGWIVVSEAYHPWWRADVDGVPAPVWRAQLAFMAVPVPAGRHRLDLVFRPPLVVRAAEVLTMAAWLALVLAIVGTTLWTALKRSKEAT